MMKYKLKVYIISEIGQRANQEDSVFPAPGQQQDSDRLFVLCDGMGGHEAGEVASSTVCQAISKSVFTNVPDAEGEFSDEQFYQALTDAYEALDEKDTTDTTGRKMGTTMTFLKLHADGCTIAHMGDSRVYHIRPGKDIDDTKILFRTEDHSLVNDLVKIGELTPEEARTSKQKNIITRAMQPHMERRPKADIYHSSDIRPGDYFYMCTDGMLEQMEDDNIRFNFSEKTGDDDNKVKVLTMATSRNRDNHTAVIVHILDVSGVPSGTEKTSKTPEPFMAEIEDGDDNEPTIDNDNVDEADDNAELPDNDTSTTEDDTSECEERKENVRATDVRRKKGVLSAFIVLVLLIVVIVAAVYYFTSGKDDDDKPQKLDIETVAPAPRPQKQSTPARRVKPASEVPDAAPATPAPETEQTGKPDGKKPTNPTDAASTAPNKTTAPATPVTPEQKPSPSKTDETENANEVEGKNNGEENAGVSGMQKKLNYLKEKVGNKKTK